MKTRSLRMSVLYLMVAMIMTAFLVSCATPGAVKVKPWAEKSPIEKATLMLHQWNFQFKDTFTLASRPNLTPAQKELVVNKKKVLKVSKVLIDLYVQTVYNGAIPSKSDEDQIVALLNSIGGILWSH